MVEAVTNLETPPEYRGGQSAESYCKELHRWATRYHLTLNAIVLDLLQMKADVAAIGTLTQVVSNPPTQAQVSAIQTKLNAVITAAIGA